MVSWAHFKCCVAFEIKAHIGLLHLWLIRTDLSYLNQFQKVTQTNVMSIIWPFSPSDKLLVDHSREMPPP